MSTTIRLAILILTSVFIGCSSNTPKEKDEENSSTAQVSERLGQYTEEVEQRNESLDDLCSRMKEIETELLELTAEPSVSVEKLELMLERIREAKHIVTKVINILHSNAKDRIEIAKMREANSKSCLAAQTFLKLAEAHIQQLRELEEQEEQIQALLAKKKRQQ